jgi:hypothetical protein
MTELLAESRGSGTGGGQDSATRAHQNTRAA